MLVIVSVDSGIKSAITDAAGKFEITGITPGAYNIKVELSGFSTINQPDVQVSGGPSDMSFTLEAGGLEETMVV